MTGLFIRKGPVVQSVDWRGQRDQKYSRNGEAVYGTRPWKVYGEGPPKVADGSFTAAKKQAFTPEDIRFTPKDG